MSNPLKTLAGSGGRLVLNVTTSDSLVNVTTGLTRTYVSGIVYSDGKVAIYQVDKVLLPIDLFAPKPPAPAPAPAKPKKEEGGEEAVAPVAQKDTSGAVRRGNLVILGVISLMGAVFSV